MPAVYHPPPVARPHPGTTPEPVYSAIVNYPGARPDAMHHDDICRARRAAQAAIQCYPGIVGEVLAREIRAYEDMRWLAERDSLIRQLIDELT